VKPGPEPDDVIDKIDHLVDPAPEPENAILMDNSRLVRWAGPLFAIFSVVLVPWIIYLGVTLPPLQVSAHYGLAWAGFDAGEFAGLASTAYFALRRSRYLATAATATATLLIVDAWFDCMTTPWPQVVESLGLCVLIELPLAAVCLWLSYHTMHIAEQRINLLRWRQAPRRSRQAAS
jgi:hypothetical protein